MQILKILIGLVLLGLAWAMMFRSGLIFRINSWLKARIFSDEIVLFSGRRVAILLLILGTVSLFSGFEHLEDRPTANPKIIAHLMNHASEEFKRGDYKHVVAVCKEIVAVDRHNVRAWELLASAQWALGDKKQSRKTVEIIKQIQPDHPFARKDPYLSFSSESSK